jgi:PEP-CTERM motif
MKTASPVGLLLAVALALASASAVEANPVIFTNRATFEAAAGGGLSFEGFEGSFGVAESIVFPGFTVSETNGINALGQLRDFPGLVDGITEGTGALVYDDNGDSVGTFLSFMNPITAFGLDITTNLNSGVSIGGFNVGILLVLAGNTPTFFGVIDLDGLTSISFDASGGPNVAFDAVSFGQVAAPEPSVLSLFGLGLAALGLRRRQRR